MSDRFLMCKPEHYGIEYEINPWMHKENVVDPKLALQQWQTFYDELKSVAEVELIQQKPGLPDMVFTANAGLTFKSFKVFALSKFAHDERMPEEEHFKQWFADRGYKVFQPKTMFEGAGDALRIGNQMMIGHGFRSQEESGPFIHRLGLMNEPETFGYSMIQLVDPRFYHLDTCYCPLKNHDFIFYPDAFTPESADQLREHGGTEIAVIEEEAERFACNAVLAGDHVFLPSGCPNTVEKLTELGYTPHEMEMSEFLKSGGACKCLTLRF